MKQDVILDDRHEFIICDDKTRTSLIKSILNNNRFDTNSDVAVLVDDIGFIKRNDSEQEELNRTAICIFNREYLIYTIAYDLLKQLDDQIGLKNIENKFYRLLDEVREYCLDDKENISFDLKALMDSIHDIKEIYYDEYIKYVKTKKLRNFLDDLPLRYLDVEMVIKNICEILEEDKKILVLVVPNKEYTMESYEAVNSLIGTHIYNNMIIKVICKNGDWKTRTDLNNNIIGMTHDYNYQEIEKPKTYKKEIKK